MKRYFLLLLLGLSVSEIALASKANRKPASEQLRNGVACFDDADYLAAMAKLNGYLTQDAQIVVFRDSGPDAGTQSQYLKKPYRISAPSVTFNSKDNKYVICISLSN